MKKKLSIIGAGVLVLGGVFFAGSIIGKAGTDWETNAINNSYSELLQTANSTKNDLVSNIDSDVNTKINTAIASDVDTQQAELERLMKEYYSMKLNNLTNTPEFLSLEQKIKDIQASVLASFKQQIDQEFTKQTQGQ
jgi:hypothetical protein